MKNFKNAVNDYRYLLNKKYSEKSSLKLVGDRYRLSGKQRNSLFRGVVLNSAAEIRRAKIVKPKYLKNSFVAIDWYNVLISVESYLKGLPVFIADDGILRDISGVHSSYKKGKITEKAFRLIISEVHNFNVKSLSVFIDAPVAFSGEMAESLRVNLKSIIELNVSVENSADYKLKSFKGVVCSSDSIIMNSAEKIFDLPLYIIEKNFDIKIPVLDELELK
jgi:hypothetical protein